VNDKVVAICTFLETYILLPFKFNV